MKICLLLTLKMPKLFHNAVPKHATLAPLSITLHVWDGYRALSSAVNCHLEKGKTHSSYSTHKSSNKSSQITVPKAFKCMKKTTYILRKFRNDSSQFMVRREKN